MSNYVIAVYVSSDPGTYMVRIRFTFQNRVWHAPCTTIGIPDVGGDPDKDDDGGSSDHSTELLEGQEPEGWVAQPISCDATRGCHFHDTLDTLLRRAFDRHTWSIEYRCVVYQHSRGTYPNRREATCLVRRPEDDLHGAEACLELYAISKKDTIEVAMQDVARHVLS
jgi:hypothetical protein